MSGISNFPQAGIKFPFDYKVLKTIDFTMGSISSAGYLTATASIFPSLDGAPITTMTNFPPYLNTDQSYSTTLSGSYLVSGYLLVNITQNRIVSDIAFYGWNGYMTKQYGDWIYNTTAEVSGNAMRLYIFYKAV